MFHSTHCFISFTLPGRDSGEREKEGKGRREGGREGGKERVGRRKESLPPTNKDFISK